MYSIAVLAFLHLAKKDGSSVDYTQIIFASLGRNLFEFFLAPQSFPKTMRANVDDQI